MDERETARETQNLELGKTKTENKKRKRIVFRLISLSITLQWEVEK